MADLLSQSQALSILPDPMSLKQAQQWKILLALFRLSKYIIKYIQMLIGTNLNGGPIQEVIFHCLIFQFSVEDQSIKGNYTCTPYYFTKSVVQNTYWTKRSLSTGFPT